MNSSFGVRVRSRAGSGLTLIEALVVLAVVGTLLALAGPGLARARSAAQATKCKSNLRQLALAMRMYVDDAGQYPLFSTQVGSQQRFWPEFIGPLLSQPVEGGTVTEGRLPWFRCPSQRPRAAATLAIVYGYSDHGFAFQGLGEKLAMTPEGWNAVPVCESDVLHPSETLALGDGVVRVAGGWLLPGGISLSRYQPYAAITIGGNLPASVAEFSAARNLVRVLHRGGVNVNFADGHVEANRLSFLFESTKDEALRPWNRDHEPHREWLP
jgi:prepilin-type processing-associated H-X9-DG protein